MPRLARRIIAISGSGADDKLRARLGVRFLAKPVDLVELRTVTLEVVASGRD